MDPLLENSCNGQTIDDIICKCRFPSEYHRRAVATLELVMVKRGVLDVLILDVVSAVATSMLCLIFFLYCVTFLLFCTSCQGRPEAYQVTQIAY